MHLKGLYKKLVRGTIIICIENMHQLHCTQSILLNMVNLIAMLSKFVFYHIHGLPPQYRMNRMRCSEWGVPLCSSQIHATVYNIQYTIPISIYIWLMLQTLDTDGFLKLGWFAIRTCCWIHCNVICMQTDQ